MEQFWMNIAIGGMSGVVSRTLTAPLDLYKIQLQNPYMPAKSPMDVIRREGIRHLWKGNLSNCIRVFPQQAINYPVYQWCLRSLPVKHKQTKTFVSGLVSGSVATVATYPLETLRSRLGLQLYGTHYHGIFHAFRVTPWRAWYQGIGVCMTGFPVFNALTFTAYNYLPSLSTLNIRKIKHKYSQDHNAKPSAVDAIVRGGIAGMLAVTVTYPTDLLRRRMQLQGFDSAVPRYDGVWSAMNAIIRQQGIRGLYRGLGVCYLKLFPASGIQFLCYQEFKKVMG